MFGGTSAGLPIFGQPIPSQLPSAPINQFPPSAPSIDGREEDHDPNELEWEASLRRHMGTFTQFDPIVSTQRVQWPKDNLAEEFNTHGNKREKFEEDREKWAREKEEMKACHLLELRKEIVRAWMRMEEREWKNSRELWKGEAVTLEGEYKDELKRIQAIASVPVTPFTTPITQNQATRTQSSFGFSRAYNY